jgi:hypothetical protein
MTVVNYPVKITNFVPMAVLFPLSETLGRLIILSPVRY